MSRLATTEEEASSEFSRLTQRVVIRAFRNNMRPGPAGLVYSWIDTVDAAIGSGQCSVDELRGVDTELNRPVLVCATDYGSFGLIDGDPWHVQKLIDAALLTPTGTPRDDVYGHAVYRVSLRDTALFRGELVPTRPGVEPIISLINHCGISELARSMAGTQSGFLIKSTFVRRDTSSPYPQFRAGPERIPQVERRDAVYSFEEI